MNRDGNVWYGIVAVMWQRLGSCDDHVVLQYVMHTRMQNFCGVDKEKV